MKVEIVRDMTIQDYLDRPEVSRSELWKMIDESPKHAHWKDPYEDSPALKFGRLYHRAVFEPETLRDCYAVLPQGVTLAMKDGKRRVKAAVDAGKEILPYKDLENLKNMLTALHEHNKAPAYIQPGGEAEVSMFFDVPGFLFARAKVRFDYWLKDLDLIVDLKTTTNAKPSMFASAAWNYGYVMQHGLYTYAAELATGRPHQMVFLVQEKSGPWDAVVFQPDEEFAVKARSMLFDEALPAYQDAVIKDQWPGKGEEVVTLSLPGWVRRQKDFAIYDL